MSRHQYTLLDDLWGHSGHPKNMTICSWTDPITLKLPGFMIWPWHFLISSFQNKILRSTYDLPLLWTIKDSRFQLDHQHIPNGLMKIPYLKVAPRWSFLPRFRRCGQHSPAWRGLLPGYSPDLEKQWPIYGSFLPTDVVKQYINQPFENDLPPITMVIWGWLNMVLPCFTHITSDQWWFSTCEHDR